MENEIQIGEIVFCNAKFKYKGRVHQLREIVYKRTDALYFNHDELIRKRKINDGVELFDIEILKRLGFENRVTAFTEAKANDNNKRNPITGAYE
jgi:hypothetical protein